MSYRCNERKRTREDNTYRVLDGAAEVEVEVAAVATSIVGSNPVACLVAVCQRHALQGRPGRAFRSLLKTTQLTDNPTLKCPRRSSVSGSTISYISTATPHTGVHTRACACACATPIWRGLCRSRSCSSPAARTDGLRIECGEVTLGAYFYLATRAAVAIESTFRLCALIRMSGTAASSPLDRSQVVGPESSTRRCRLREGRE